MGARRYCFLSQSLGTFILLICLNIISCAQCLQHDLICCCCCLDVFACFFVVQFDSSRDRAQPFEFKVWQDEGILIELTHHPRSKTWANTSRHIPHTANHKPHTRTHTSRATFNPKQRCSSCYYRTACNANPRI